MTKAELSCRMLFIDAEEQHSKSEINHGVGIKGNSYSRPSGDLIPMIIDGLSIDPFKDQINIYS